MRAVLTSFGSAGDFEPFLALAIEMKKSGHEPVLAYLPQFASRAERHGIEFFPIGSPAFFDSVQQSMKIEIESGILNAVAHMQSYPVGQMIRLFNDLFRACNRADAVICSATWPFGRMIHEATGMPFVSVHMDHFNEEFARESSDHISAWEEQLTDFFNPFLKRLGLRELRHSLTTDGNSEQLALFAVSRFLLDPAKEPRWPAHHHVTGFFFVDEESHTPDEKLAEFIEAGEPPVVFTFGSMVYDDPKLADLFLEVIERIDRRVIVVNGWSALFQDRELPPDVYITDFVHFSWLFSRVSCVVQTGGAGTTALALRAGAPNVCIPHLWHQFSFASLPKAYGCGLVVPHKELTADNLTDAITEVLNNAHYTEAAHEIGRQIRAEGGALLATRLIEKWYEALPETERQPLAPGIAAHRAKTDVRPAL